MPGDIVLVTHWHAELEVLSTNLLLLHEGMNADAVHDLRVAIKKLRSYLRLCIEVIEKEQEGMSLERTRELFSALGKHRNIEITRQSSLSFARKKTDSMHSLLVYLELLQDQIAEHCRSVILHYDKTEPGKVGAELTGELEKLDAEEFEARVRKIIQSCMANVKDHLKHFQQKSHLIRKDLKNIFYWLKIFPDDFVLSKSQLKLMDKTLDHLGRVQDHEVLLANLKTFRKTVLSQADDEYDFIRRIEGRAKKKKETLLDQAEKMAEELVSE